jgi:hypothetical protein
MDRKWVDDGDLMLMSSCHDYLLFSPAAAAATTAAVPNWGKIIYKGAFLFISMCSVKRHLKKTLISIETFMK